MTALSARFVPTGAKRINCSKLRHLFDLCPFGISESECISAEFSEDLGESTTDISVLAMLRNRQGEARRSVEIEEAGPIHPGVGVGSGAAIALIFVIGLELRPFACRRFLPMVMEFFAILS